MSDVRIVEINEGSKIDYHQSNNKITFGDDEVTLNLAKYQRDWPVHLDICQNRDGQLVVGIGEGLYYVAQVDIPKITYEEQEGGEGDSESVIRTALPLDMENVTLTLWNIDNLISAL